jgi:hypothetical protein
MVVWKWSTRVDHGFMDAVTMRIEPGMRRYIRSNDDGKIEPLTDYMSTVLQCQLEIHVHVRTLGM